MKSSKELNFFLQKFKGFFIANLILIFSLIFSSCTKTKKASEVKYAMKQVSERGEFLRQMKKAGRINLCVFFEGFEKEDELRRGKGLDSILEKAKRYFSSKVIELHMAKALDSWTSVFHAVDDSFWPEKKTSLEVFYAPQCGDDPYKIWREDFWPESVLGKAKDIPILSLIIANPSTAKSNRAYANGYNRLIWWPVEWKDEDGKFDFSLDKGSLLLAHEFGHIFGLSDTYDEEFGGTLEGQPTALMNYHKLGFSNDDYAAARTMMRFLKTGSLTCESGYRPFRYENWKNLADGASGSFFCVKNGSSLIDSYAVLDPKEWEYVLPNYIEEFDENVQQENRSIFCGNDLTAKLEIQFLSWKKSELELTSKVKVEGTGKIEFEKKCMFTVARTNQGINLSTNEVGCSDYSLFLLGDTLEKLTNTGAHYTNIETQKIEKKLERAYRGFFHRTKENKTEEPLKCSYGKSVQKL